MKLPANFQLDINTLQTWINKYSLKLSTNFQLDINTLQTWINKYSSLMDINLNIYDKEVQLFILLISLIFIIILSLIPILRPYLFISYRLTDEQHEEIKRLQRETLKDMSINNDRDRDKIYYKLSYQYAYNKVVSITELGLKLPLYSRRWGENARLNSREKWRIYVALRNKQDLAEIGYTLPYRQIKGLNGKAYSSPALIVSLFAYENLG